MRETLIPHTQTSPRRLSDAEVEAALKAVEEAGQHQAAILARRKGKLLPSSVPLIRKDREERSRGL